MTGIRDANFYPKPFQSFEVTDTDANGNPTETTFYRDNDLTSGQEVFKWVQTFDENDKVETFKVVLL